LATDRQANEQMDSCDAIKAPSLSHAALTDEKLARCLCITDDIGISHHVTRDPCCRYSPRSVKDQTRLYSS